MSLLIRCKTDLANTSSIQEASRDGRATFESCATSLSSLPVIAREDEIGLETPPSDLLVENGRHETASKPLKVGA